jgi:integrase
MQAQATADRRLVKTRTPGIYQRGNRYVVRYRDPHGRQRKAFARTLAEARDLKATLTADVKRGEFRQLSNITFGEYAPTWIATYAGRTSRGLRDQTKRDYARDLGLDPDRFEALDPARFAVKFFGRMKLSAIEPRDVKAYAAEVAKRGVKANTVRLALAPVKALLATAVEEGLIRSNPSAGLRIAQPNNSAAVEDAEPEKAKALTEDELHALLAAVPDESRLLVTLLAQAGLRISEALPLRWGDIDFGRSRLLVRRSLSRGRIGAPKSRFGRRDVPLTQGMTSALWAARKAAIDGRDEALIFPAADGGFLDRWHVYRVVKAAAKKTGVPWAGLHTLRHTCATILFRRGWNAVQVQKLMGHHSPAFTLATYVHLLDEDLPEPTFLDEIAAVDVEAARREADSRGVGV